MFKEGVSAMDKGHTDKEQRIAQDDSRLRQHRHFWASPGRTTADRQGK